MEMEVEDIPVRSDNPNRLISVESTNEWQIFEILLDGQEKYLQPQKFTDHVARLAHLINWRELVETSRHGDEKADDSLAPCSSIQACGPSTAPFPDISELAIQKTDEQHQQTTDINQNQPWSKVATRLLTAHSELNVLHDVLRAILLRRFALSPTEIDVKGQDYRLAKDLPQVYIRSKKQAIGSAGQKLSNAIEKLRPSSSQFFARSFQSELLALRRRWRIKKTGSDVRGDLALKATGTRFRPEATFEVIETGDPVETLQVKLPPNLKQSMVLQLKVTSSTGVLITRNSLPMLAHTTPTWERQLEDAQVTLANQDMFEQLCYEAVRMEDRVCAVERDCIVMRVCDEVNVEISLVPTSRAKTKQEDVEVSTIGLSLAWIFDNIQRRYLKQLERDPQNSQEPLRPFSCPVPVGPAVLRLAGPHGLGSAETQPVLDEWQSPTMLLERVAAFVEHKLLADRIVDMLECLGSHNPDTRTSLRCSTDLFADTPQTIFALTLHTRLTPQTYQSLLWLELREGVVRLVIRNEVTARDSVSLTVTPTPDMQDLLRVVKMQIAQHLVLSVQRVFSVSGWNTLGCSMTLNTVWVDEECRLQPGVVVAHPQKNFCLSIHIPVDGCPTVEMQHNRFNPIDIDEEEGKELMQMQDSLEYDKLPGDSLAEKMTLLASSYFYDI